MGNRSDVKELPAAADLFVFPSLFEGYGGNALIEAMTLDDITRVARRLIEADRLITTIVGKPVGLEITDEVPG